ncbi:hypothetical protein EW026_g1829 [Hermanssonia centrifuga]|uniref:Rho-GAP domain-containing protein n=1 Tax=Hermanssonia centrifuga TaxID=98765 RepID=A0A4S4KR24_9APHY|nr:hypothetical protein EW026_g1829 [Hermanssonia centrifuga]
MRSDTSELVRLRLQEALADTNGRGSTHVKLDVEFVGAIMTLLEQRKEEYDDMKRRLDGMKRTSQQYMDGLTVAQTEYDRELKARRDAEAEVTRLRVLLSGQAVRLTAISGETRRQEAQKLHSQELSQSLSSLERDLAKLQVERDMTLAEVEELSASKRTVNRLIPVIVEKCIDAVDVLALDYEGIYRKTGGSGQSKTITQLFERGDYASFDLRDNDRFNDICSVTSVLKTYFRSLPDPLLTYALHEQFIAASTMKDPAMKSSALTELVAELPREHYHTTRALMLHLHRIYERSDRNLMHARNLGVVFGPTLMRSRDPNAEFTDMAGKALTVEWLVENAPTVFEQFDALDIS